MKKRKILSAVSILASLVMMFNIVSVSVWARESPWEGEVCEEEIFLEGMGGLEDTEGFINFAAVSGAEFTDCYYDQLDGDSKEAYESMLEEYGSASHGDYVTIAVSKVFQNATISYDNGVWAIDNASKTAIYQWINDVVGPALAALIYDRPELSWLVNAGYGVTFSRTTAKLPSGTGMIVQDVKVVSYKYRLTDIYTDTGDINDITTAIATAKETLDHRLIPSEGNYGIVKRIHDYICNNVSYTDGDRNLRIYQTPYSSLCGEHITVCTGYAKAFKLLCNAYDIPCILVRGTTHTGGAHMWNYVKLGGVWYGVDTTWDDDDEGVSYDYFLAGSTTLSTGTVKREFIKSHIPSGVIKSPYTFSLPLLAQKEHTHDYPEWVDTGDGNHRGTCACGYTVTYPHIHLDYTVTKEATCGTVGEKTYVCLACGANTVYYIPATGIHTWDEGVVTVKPTYRETGTKIYTCKVCEKTYTEILLQKEIILGDINLDGRLNSKDVLDMKKYFAALITIDEYQKYAANVNGDRVINSRDLQALKKILAAES